MKKGILTILLFGMTTLFICGCASREEGHSAESKEAADLFEAVLQGDGQFLYIADSGMVESVNIVDVPEIFDADDPYMKIWEYSLADLDGDGEEEVILSVFGVNGAKGGKMILHRIDNEIYGYRSHYRMLVDLKADGTYSYSDPTGVVEGGIGIISGFSEKGYTVDKVSYGTGTYEGWNTFIVDHQSATEDEYLAAVARQEEKPDVVWKEFILEPEQMQEGATD